MPPIFGGNDSTFFLGCLSCIALQALAFWRWANCIPPDALLVNMDECSLGFYMDQGKGTVIIGLPQAGIRASLSLRRSRVTFMAGISSDRAFNLLVPQVLVVNNRQFSLKLITAIERDVGDRLQLWRSHTAWTTSVLMRRYITSLHEKWQSFCPERPLWLIIDCAASHLEPSVLVHARSLGVTPIVVPSHTTHLLQPLDAYVFAHLRTDLRRRWVAARSQSLDSTVSKAQWVSLVADASEHILARRDWKRAFEGTGIIGQQAGLSSRLLQELQWAACPEIPIGMPSLGQASSIFPPKKTINVSQWLHGEAIEPPYIRTLN